MACGGQPSLSGMTLKELKQSEGEDYMVHHGMTARDSERQHLLAAGTAGPTMYS